MQADSPNFRPLAGEALRDFLSRPTVCDTPPTNSYVYAGGSPLATQEGTGAQVRWEHRDPTNVSIYWTYTDSSVSAGEYDPLGVSVPEVPGLTMVNNSPYNSGSFGSPDMGCMADNVPMSCSEARRLIASGIGAPCPHNDCGPQYDGGGWQFFHFTEDGLFYGGLNAYPGQSQGDQGGVPYLRDRNGNVVHSDKTTPAQRRAYDRSHPYRPELGFQIMDVGFHPPGGDNFSDAYNNCLSELGNAPAPGEGQAKVIIDIANKTGVDRTLLAATWRYEGGVDSNGFVWNPTNGPHGDGTADIGPGQLNPSIWDKSPYTAGLGDPFGTNRDVGQVFNGNGYHNLVVTARALLSGGGSREHQAGIFRAGHEFNKQKGSKKKQKVTNPTYQARVDAFNGVAPNYDAFFNCMKGKGF